LAPPGPVRVEKCIEAIRHLPSAFVTVSEMLMGNSNAFPSFLPLMSPDASALHQRQRCRRIDNVAVADYDHLGAFRPAIWLLWQIAADLLHADAIH
jgi:hypothetical protein